MSGFTRAPRLRLVGALTASPIALSPEALSPPRLSPVALLVIALKVSRLLAALLLVTLVAEPLLAQSQHVVQRGDTLYALAARYGTTVEILRQENALSGSLLRVGQLLELPVEAGFRFESAEAGETLAQMASRLGLSESALRSANPGLAEPLAPGTKVRVPPGEGVSLRLGEDDSLLEWAMKFGISPSDLLEVNDLDALAAVGPGDWVYLPVPPGAAAVGGAAEESRPLADPVVADPLWHARQQEALLSRAPSLLAGFVPDASVFVMPLRGRLSSSYGWRNISVGGNQFHGGIDLAVDRGTPVAAALGGVVVRAGWVGAYGYAVYIDHGDGLQTRYAHLSELLVAVGESVRQGDIIARAGSTGASTGPHLHFEIRVKGQAVDPLSLLSR